MYFRLSWEPSDEQITYLLCKNPTSPPFEKDLSGEKDRSRVVRGMYFQNNYEIVVHNDETKLIARYRKENRASYISAAPYAVNPRNIKGVLAALKSAIDGKAKGVDEAEITRPRNLRARIGPFLAPSASVYAMFGSLGLVVNLRGPEQPETEVARVYDVDTFIGPHYSLAEFLQRVFIGAYALSIKDHDEYMLQESLVESLIEMSKGWLGQCAGAERVTAALARGRKGLLEKFREAIKDETLLAELPEDEAPEQKLETKVSLHQRRHETIVKALEGARIHRVVDLGCGDGGLLARVRAALPEGAEVSMLAIDADTQRVLRVKRRGKIKARNWNILLPKPTHEELSPSLLLCSEVIEHLSAEDRRTLIKQICELWQPQMIALTTPNVAYNVNWGLKPGELRHSDHRIEYTLDELRDEVTTPLEAGGYTTQILPVLGFEAEEVQPSFIVIARRKATEFHDPAKAEQHLRWISNAYSPFAVAEVGYSIGAPELEEGTRHPVYRHHRQGAFFLSPTMAPVDYNPAFGGILEHPSTAIAYYAARGVHKLIMQPKWMGSRAHLLVFREKQYAERAGFDSQVVVTSRGGFPFFDKEELDELTPKILSDINWASQGKQRDFYAFDAEILPWVHKAAGLIREEFLKPGEAAKIYYAMQGAVPESVEKYLQVLKHFAAPGPLQFRLFGLLAWGSVDESGRFTGVELPALSMSHTLQSVFLRGICLPSPQLLYPPPTFSVSDMAFAMQFWEDVCNAGGEGVVIKPDNPQAILTDGAPMQPALKVRGPDYLRLIYGMDYQKPENFDQLKRRHTSAKRRVAIQEHALSRHVLMSYFKNMRREHAKFVAAFLGMDGLASPSLDKTL